VYSELEAVPEEGLEENGAIVELGDGRLVCFEAHLEDMCITERFLKRW